MKTIFSYVVVLLFMIMLTTQTGIAFDTKEPSATDPQQLGAAAQKGDAKAMYELGKRYENGVGVIQNYVQAHTWYNIAASRGYTEAAKARDAVAKKMSVNQLEKAQELAINWKPSQGSDAPAKAGAKEGESKKGGEKEAARNIWDAAKDGNTARVKELLKQGTDPNTKDKDGWFPLIYAAYGGHKETVEALLEAGADVNMKKPDGSTALMVADMMGYPEISTLLKSKSPQSARKLRSIPEPNLSYGSATAMLKDKGLFADWENKTASDYPNEYELQGDGKVVYDRSSGLMWQQSGSDKLLCIYLKEVEAKQYLSQLNREGFAGYRDWRLPTLEEAMSLMEPTKMNGNLHINPKFDNKQTSILTSDSELNVSPDHCGRWNHSINYEGVSLMSCDSFVRAVRSDVKLESVSKEVSAGIWDAVKNGDTATVKRLLKQGTDPNMKNKEGWTPLMYAAFGGHTEIVDALLTFGADVNMKKPDGATALMAAALRGHKCIVDFLLDEDADRFVTSNKGLTALKIAEEKGYQEIVTLLKHIKIEYESKKQFEIWKQQITERAERANGFLNEYHGIYAIQCEDTLPQVTEKYSPPNITICWSEGDEVCFADPDFEPNLEPKKGKLVKRLKPITEPIGNRFSPLTGQWFAGQPYKIMNPAPEKGFDHSFEGKHIIIGFDDKKMVIMDVDMKKVDFKEKCEGF